MDTVGCIIDDDGSLDSSACRGTCREDLSYRQVTSRGSLSVSGSAGLLLFLTDRQEGWNSMSELIRKTKNRGWIAEELRRGSITVETAFLAPVIIGITLLLIFYCFCEHARVWYAAAACEAALAGTIRSVDSQEPEELARIRGLSRIEEQPFPVTEPLLEVTVEGKKVAVVFQVSGAAAMERYFPYTVQSSVKQTDPVGGVRTAWLAKNIINGGE